MLKEDTTVQAEKFFYKNTRGGQAPLLASLANPPFIGYSKNT